MSDVFNFANQATGTAPLNLAYSLDKASVFMNFSVPGSNVGEKTYYYDTRCIVGCTAFKFAIDIFLTHVFMMLKCYAQIIPFVINNSRNLESKNLFLNGY